jgi:hypothetical protein
MSKLIHSLLQLYDNRDLCGAGLGIEFNVACRNEGRQFAVSIFRNISDTK